MIPLCEVSRVVTFIETESRRVHAGGWGTGERGELLVNHHSFRSAFENLLRIGCITMWLSLTLLDCTVKKAKVINFRLHVFYQHLKCCSMNRKVGNNRTSLLPGINVDHTLQSPLGSTSPVWCCWVVSKTMPSLAGQILLPTKAASPPRRRDEVEGHGPTIKHSSYTHSISLNLSRDHS